MELEIDVYLIFNNMEVVIFFREQSDDTVATESNELLKFVNELSKKKWLYLYKSEPFDMV